MAEKNVVICVCGGIAAYKMVEVVSRLKKIGISTHVAMTDSAREFITPLTFQSISGNKVYTSLTEYTEKFEIPHIVLAQQPDLIVIAPATANTIGKIANGISDDLISTIATASKAPILFAPAMNTAMYENQIVQQNILRLKTIGYKIIDPEIGTMAMKGEGVGIGRLPDPSIIVDNIIEMLNNVE